MKEELKASLLAATESQRKAIADLAAVYQTADPVACIVVHQILLDANALQNRVNALAEAVHSIPA